MSEVGTEISTLLDNTVKAAPKITSPLKKIGDGDMLKGIRTIYDFAMKEGFTRGDKSGAVKGSIGTLFGMGVLYGGYRGVKFIKNKMVEEKKHQSDGEKILRTIKGINPSEEKDSMSAESEVPDNA